ncbi:MAG: laccase domain-containing protein [Acidimicrobiales bacterium]
MGSNPAPERLIALRHGLVPRPWFTLHQVHGAEVMTVGERQAERSGAEGQVGPEPKEGCLGWADGLVSSAGDAALAVMSADCATIALASPEGVMGALHAGWRGLVAGVVESGVQAMRQAGASQVVGALGPCIHPECYEFAPNDLDRVSACLGPEVRAKTATGRPALDLPRAVGAALRRAGAESLVDFPEAAHCTSCTPGYFSYRARGEAGRQALVVWRE